MGEGPKHTSGPPGQENGPAVSVWPSAPAAAGLLPEGLGQARGRADDSKLFGLDDELTPTLWRSLKRPQHSS